MERLEEERNSMYQTVKIMVAMDDVDSLCIIPREALGREEILRDHIIIGQSYDTAVNVDVMPQSCCLQVVRAVTVHCLFAVGIDQFSGQGG